MAKHTPGPWWIDDENSVGAGNEVVAIVKPPVDRITLNVIEEQWNANACLIAASPDMFAALQAVVAFIEGKPDAPEPFGIVRAAIAKATGEQQ